MVVAMIVVEKVRYDEAGRGEGGEEEVDGRVIEGMGSVALVGVRKRWVVVRERLARRRSLG